MQVNLFFWTSKDNNKDITVSAELILFYQFDINILLVFSGANLEFSRGGADFQKNFKHFDDLFLDRPK